MANFLFVDGNQAMRDSVMADFKRDPTFSEDTITVAATTRQAVDMLKAKTIDITVSTFNYHPGTEGSDPLRSDGGTQLIGAVNRDYAQMPFAFCCIAKTSEIKWMLNRAFGTQMLPDDQIFGEFKTSPVDVMKIMKARYFPEVRSDARAKPESALDATPI